MKFLRCLTKPKMSWLELMIVLVLVGLIEQYANYWLYLLVIPVGFMNGFLSIYVKKERPTLYFDHFDSAKDYMINNLSEMRETGADITIKHPLNNN